MNKREEQFSLQVFIVGAILAATFFLLFVDAFKTYTSSITVLVNAKSQVAASQQDRITGSIIELPRTLSFYDRLLKYNKDVRDVAAGQSQDQRKKIWNDMFSIERVGGNSSVFKISITTSRESDSDLLAQKTVRTLFDVTAMYYDVKKDVDLRIIDGPISHSNVTGWYWTLPLSIALGFLIALFLQYVLSKGKEALADGLKISKEKSLFDFKKETSKKSGREIRSLEDLYAAEQAEAPFWSWGKNKIVVSPQEKPAGKTAPQIKEMKKITKMFEPDKYPNFRETPKAGPSRVDERSSSRVEAGSPDNLPVADEFFFSQPEYENDSQIIEAPIVTEPAEEKKPEIHPEPTAEQLKERLNRLLKGEL